MSSFELPWSIEEVLALVFEEDLHKEWLKVPTGDPLEKNVKVCDTLYSLHARVPI